MHEHGLLQPVLVRRRARSYELIAGHRRLAAAQQLGWQTVPALVREGGSEQNDVLQMVENLQRQNLSPEEEADGLAGLIRRHNWTTREVARAIHRSQTYVSKRVRVYEDPVLRDAVLEGGLTPTAAEELLPLDVASREHIAQRALQEGWGVTEVRQAVRSSPQALGALHREPDTAVGVGLEADTQPAIVQLNERQPRGALRRPRGFTTMLRALRSVVRRILPHDLTEADQRELRLLFMDLALLAKANPAKREIVLPPLQASASRR